MWDKLYSSNDTPSSFVIVCSIVWFLAEIAVIVFIIKRVFCRLSKIGIVTLVFFLSIMIYSSMALFNHFSHGASSSEDSDLKLSVSGKIRIIRDSSLLAGSEVGIFHVGGKDFEYGFNSKNYLVTEYVSKAKTGESYRIEYDSSGVITALFRKIPSE